MAIYLLVTTTSSASTFKTPRLEYVVYFGACYIMMHDADEPNAKCRIIHNLRPPIQTRVGMTCS